ncbi:hypothetical protein P4571_08305 [Niallia alba]|uniref:hypothetical protein n=1 Tax=Niallia alba TaxID=2729105 RepID=UPI002E1E3B78|nr:hypothetical protein [Niallia alba]
MIDEKWINIMDYMHKYKESCTKKDFRMANYYLDHIKDDLEGLYHLTTAMGEEK